MESPFTGKTIWFLTGSQHLYGPATLDAVATQSRAVVARLTDDPDLPIRVLWRPVVTDSDAILAQFTAANSDPQCVGVIAWMHTFSPAKMWIRGLHALQKPLLHLHTQAGQSLPWATLDMDFMNLNQAAHGDREFGYIQTRMGVPRYTVCGHVEQDETRRRIATWARVAAAFDTMRRTRLARFGDNMRAVAVTEGDKVDAEVRFGASVNTYAVNDLVATVDAVSEGEIDTLIEQYQGDYEIAETLRPGGEWHDSLRYGARIEAGLRQFLTAGRFTAFTTNFDDLGGLRQLPGLAVQRLMADGYGFGGEGDWKTALLVRTFKVMASGLPGGTSFMEDYTYHYGPGRPKVLGAHMLEVCPSLTARRPSLEIHPLGIGGREDPVRLKFTADPGPAVVVGLSYLGGRFRLTANAVDVVEPNEELPRLPVAHAVWEPRPSLTVSAECWLAAGGPHHTVLSTALSAEHVEIFATMTGTELALIDADTTRRAFQNELRWNEPYFQVGPVR